MNSFLVAVAVGVLCPSARAQREHVYLVKPEVKERGTVAIEQTGFRVKGIRGVVTALHGVLRADKDKVNVQEEKEGGVRLPNPLKIAWVDVERDLAILTSPELDRMPVEGLQPAINVDWKLLANTQVRVIGYPHGVDLKAVITPVMVRDTALEPLEIIVGPKVRESLNERKSPKPGIPVLNLHGDLGPGHSGAPILDSKNRVLAVGNGGLDAGRVGHGWAVLLHGARWRSIDDGFVIGELARLKRLPTPFAFRNPLPARNAALTGPFKELDFARVVRLIGPGTVWTDQGYPDSDPINSFKAGDRVRIVKTSEERVKVVSVNERGEYGGRSGWLKLEQANEHLQHEDKR